MIELLHDELTFMFPDVHPEARLRITLQRTLRIPEDDQSYPLPPGLGRFPIRHIDDYRDRVPASSIRRGGVIVPMYQSEALWISFDSDTIPDHRAEYPFVVQIAAGKINAVSGENWQEGLTANPQSYVVVPKQPWLDGFNIGRGIVRQFVAMPLGSGFTVEEQVTGAAEHGGLQISVSPMKREEFESRFPKVKRGEQASTMMFGRALPSECQPAACYDMGLAPGGRMRQKIASDSFGAAVWNTTKRSRCFIHLLDALTWRQVTRANPPHPPFTAHEYARLKLPWFEYYDNEIKALDGNGTLSDTQPTSEIAKQKQQARPVMPDAAQVTSITTLYPKHDRAVREGEF